MRGVVRRRGGGREMLVLAREMEVVMRNNECSSRCRDVEFRLPSWWVCKS